MTTVNALWFWGQGALPSAVHHGFARIESSAWDIRALAAQGTVDVAADEADLHAFHAVEIPYVFGTGDRTPPRWPQGGATMARPACVPGTTRTTTPPS